MPFAKASQPLKNAGNFFRADAAERGRKEVEHRVMSTEDAIETLEAKLKEARHLTEEASRKHDETIYKLDREDAQIQLN